MKSRNWYILSNILGVGGLAALLLTSGTLMTEGITALTLGLGALSIASVYLAVLADNAASTRWEEEERGRR